MNRNTLFIVLIIFGSLMSLNSQTAADYSILYSRIYSSNFGGGRSSYALSNQKADGSFNSTVDLRDHLDEMLKIAKTYQTTTSASYHSEDLLNAYVKVNLTDEEYNELQRLIKLEEKPVTEEMLPGMILQAVRNLKNQTNITK